MLLPFLKGKWYALPADERDRRLNNNTEKKRRKGGTAEYQYQS